MSFSSDDVVKTLGNLTVLELIALTKELEQKWGVKAEPQAVQVQQVEQQNVVTQTEFNVVLASVPADKKMAVIKLVRETIQLGLKESKELVEAAPKVLKEGISKEEAEILKGRFVEAGATVEVK